MNIILLIIDSLRYDYIGANGNDWIKTPNLDALAKRSWVFDRSFSASFPTIPHRTDVITGKYGGPFHPWMPLRFDHVTLPDLLAEAGYATQLIHDTPHLVNGGHNFDFPFRSWTQIRGAEADRPWITPEAPWLENWAWDPLFDQFDKKKTKQSLRAYRSANVGRTKDEEWNTPRLFATAAKWLEQNKDLDDFFLWIDCFDPHEPWEVPPEYARLYDPDPGYDGRIDPRGFQNLNSPDMTDAARERVRSWYGGKVTWVDHWFGELIATLQETHLADRTALIVTADHGTNMGDWGGRFHKRTPVHEQESHTPMIVYLPGAGSGRSSVFVQPQDIFSTICGIAGTAPPKAIESFDFLAQARGESEPARPGALSGIALGAYASVAGAEEARRESRFFTVFGESGYLIFDADPAESRYYRYGEEEERSGAEQSTVEELHRYGIAELARRGADPKLLDWLRTGAKGPVPDGCVFWDGYPGPAGYTQYYLRQYGGG